MKKIVINLFHDKQKKERKHLHRHSDHKINQDVLNEIHAQAPDELELHVPHNGKTEVLHLHRVHHNPIIKTGSGYIPEKHKGLFYQAKGSYATVHFTDHAAHILFSNESGNINISHEGEGDHVSFNESQLVEKNPFVCETIGETIGESNVQGLAFAPIALTTVQKKIGFHWEVNYEVFQNLKTVAAVQSFALGLFNQAQALYAANGIVIELQSLKIWDVPSPFIGTTAGALLNEFTQAGAFDGDLAVLIGYHGSGGVSYVGVLCAFSPTQQRCYCGISSSYAGINVYSWTVEVVTHEPGHMIGSNHTHSCSWNGNGTKIDDCGTHAGYPEGVCGDDIADPVGGGTIMSYCHLRSVGINFSKGFGDQPSALMINNINNAPCLKPVGTNPCPQMFTPTIQITADKTSVTSGQSVTISASVVTHAGTAPAYQVFRDGVAVGTNVPYTFTPTANCSVYVKMTSNDTCLTTNEAISNTIAITITPVPPPPPPPSGGTATITPITGSNPLRIKCTFTYCTNVLYKWYVNGVDINFHQQIFTPTTNYPDIKAGDTIQCKITGARCITPVSSNILIY